MKLQKDKIISQSDDNVIKQKKKVEELLNQYGLRIEYDDNFNAYAVNDRGLRIVNLTDSFEIEGYEAYRYHIWELVPSLFQRKFKELELKLKEIKGMI